MTTTALDARRSPDARRYFQETGQLPSGSARLRELDALRGIAASMVVAVHFGICLPGYQSNAVLDFAYGMVSMGWAGVDLFFVLSGFLIGSILLKYRGTPNFFRAFYVRRAARLFPLYFVTCGTYFLLRPALVANGSDVAIWLLRGDGRELPSWSYFFYLQNFYQASLMTGGSQWLMATWSLAIEEQFYLLAPLFIWVVPRQRLGLWFVTLAVMAMLFRTMDYFNTGSWVPGDVLLVYRADSLLSGMCGALLVSNAAIRARLVAHKRALAVCFYVACLAFVAMTVFKSHPSDVFITTVGHTVLAVMSLAVIFGALFTDVWFVRVVLRSRVLIALGDLSYAIYLLHMPVLGLVVLGTGVAFGADQRLPVAVHLALACLVASLTFLLAKLSQVWLERPFLALGHRYQYNGKGAAPQRIEQLA